MKRILPLLAFFALTACAQYGRYISQEMVANITPGMTAAQVRGVLGQPMVETEDLVTGRMKWTYVYVRAVGLPFYTRVRSRSYEVSFGKDGKVVEPKSMAELIQEAQNPTTKKDKNP